VSPEIGHHVEHAGLGGMHGNESGGFAYVLGFLGALYYYMTTATSFMAVIIGFLKALVWPAFLVYGILTALAI